MDGALLACQQAGAHLDAAGAQGEGGGGLPPVRDAAGGHHRDAHRVDDLGHQGHGGHLAHVAAGLRALGDDGVHAVALQPLGQDRSGHHGDDLDALFLPGGDVFAGVAGAGGDHLHILLQNDLGDVVGIGAHQHQVDAEGLVRQLLGPADLLAETVAVPAAGGDHAQGPGVGAGGGELAGGDVGHAALDEGILGSQDLIELFHKNLPFAAVCGPNKAEVFAGKRLASRAPASYAGGQANSTRAPPQVRPPPKPTTRTREPGPTFPRSWSSLMTRGMLAAEVLPYFWMFL